MAMWLLKFKTWCLDFMYDDKHESMEELKILTSSIFFNFGAKQRPLRSIWWSQFWRFQILNGILRNASLANSCNRSKREDFGSRRACALWHEDRMPNSCWQQHANTRNPNRGHTNYILFFTNFCYKFLWFSIRKFGHAEFPDWMWWNFWGLMENFFKMMKWQKNWSRCKNLNNLHRNPETPTERKLKWLAPWRFRQRSIRKSRSVRTKCFDSKFSKLNFLWNWSNWLKFNERRLTMTADDWLIAGGHSCALNLSFKK